MVFDKLRIQKPWLREFLSEFMGTFVVMMIGNSAMAHMLLKGQHDLFAVTFAWGIAVMMGMLIGASNSGGHVNPMVSIGFASIGLLPWSKVPHYVAGQLFGAFTSCFPLYLNYRDLLHHFDNGTRQILGEKGSGILWTTFPDPNVSMTTCVLDTIICTSIIMFGILAIVDKNNAAVPGYLHSFYVSLLVMTVVWTMGSNCMCAINPARDFAPRIFAVMVGYGDAFSHRGFWWIPLVMPVIGGIIGCYAYELTIGNHVPAKQKGAGSETKELDVLNEKDAKKELPKRDESTPMV
ncbi:aquaporin-10 [Galendromus occidentalis]|uniref:Aquaporin-10 n=1 Tax=Galendromus occidentalis TaxID=34638 RepID=A0AAJ6VYZ1_9ACAR|nr:aquaporin-10 [Galendromus occidentalis]